MRWLSVVMPVRNEAAGIIQVLEPLQGLRDRIQIIVVDGGSTDGTAALAAPLVDRMMESAPGRARQMNAGAAAASGEVLVFLHADTQLPDGFDGMIRQALGVVAAGPQAKDTTPLSSNAAMDPRVREDDVGGERGVVSPDSSLSKTTVLPATPNVIPAYPHVIPASPNVISASPNVIPGSPNVIPAKAGIHSDLQQAPSPDREPSARPSPTMDPRVRKDDGGGEAGATVTGTARASHLDIPATPNVIPATPNVIPASPNVIPAKAGIHSDLQQAPSPDREPSARPNPTMDPRVREDDCGVEAGPRVREDDVGGEAGPRVRENDGRPVWGRFDVQLSPSSPTLRLVAWMMNHRSRLTGICTGDQALFVRRDLFNQLGGYADIPLMEDIELSKRLKRLSPPACIHQPLTTSSRRWQSQGVLRTVALMWWLRLQYWSDVSPAKLVETYYPGRQSGK